MPMLNKLRPLFRQISGDKYILAEELNYLDVKTGDIYTVPGGTQWDMGTVLKLIPRAIVPHSDEMTYPSALHDKFYTDFSVAKATADRIFRQFLIEEKLARWRAWAAWGAVRLNFRAAWQWNK